MSLDSVSLKIDGDEWVEWHDISLTVAIDEPSTISLTAPWDPERRDMREAFKPYQYQDIAVAVEGEQVFAGYALTPNPQDNSGDSQITLTGYAKAGVLQDVTMPADAWPLELNKLKFDGIASRLTRPFGFGAQAWPGTDVGAQFERVEIESADGVWAKLTELAKQRNLLLSSAPNGDLLYRGYPVALATVLDLERGKPPLVSCTARFNGQVYISEATATASTKLGAKGGKQTFKNTALSGRVRPMVFQAEDSEKGDLLSAAKAKMGRIFAESATWEVVVPQWRDDNGDLLTPGNFVSILNPGAMIYSRQRMMIRKVTFSQGTDSQSATIELVLKEAFSGEIPEGFPWD